MDNLVGILPCVAPLPFCQFCFTGCGGHADLKIDRRWTAFCRIFWPPLQVHCFFTTVRGVDHNSDNLIFLVYRSILVTIWIMDFMCTKGKDTKMPFSFRYFSLSHQDKKQVVKGNDRAAPQKWEGWSQVWDREGRHSWTKISFLGSSRPSCNVLPTRPTREECAFCFWEI